MCTIRAARVLLLCLLFFLTFLTSGALAQPSTDLTGGVLIIHSPPWIWCNDPPRGGVCEFGEISDCASQLNDQKPLGGDLQVWWVLAAFAGESEWCGVEFGIVYTGVSVSGHSMCVPSNGLEIQAPGWPESGTGTSIVTTDVPWVGTFAPVYYFWGYSYYAPGGTFSLCDSPATPGSAAFSNCDQEEFPAECYGTLGFGEFMGVDCCPEAPQPEPWACCLYVGICAMEFEEACAELGGVWHEGLTCDEITCPVPMVCCIDHDCVILHADECLAQGGEPHPVWVDCYGNPCDDLTPVGPSTWGAIKAIYR
jgi:hypothetical protein